MLRSNDLDIEWKQYKIGALFLHYGADCRSGHYIAIPVMVVMLWWMMINLVSTWQLCLSIRIATSIFLCLSGHRTLLLLLNPSGKYLGAHGWLFGVWSDAVPLSSALICYAWLSLKMSSDAYLLACLLARLSLSAEEGYGSQSELWTCMLLLYCLSCALLFFLFSCSCPFSPLCLLLRSLLVPSPLLFFLLLLLLSSLFWLFFLVLLLLVLVACLCLFSHLLVCFLFFLPSCPPLLFASSPCSSSPVFALSISACLLGSSVVTWNCELRLSCHLIEHG